MDWRHSYQETARRTAAALRDMRTRGVTSHRLVQGGAVVNPSRLSDGKIDELARRHAEAVVQQAINQHNESVDRMRAKGRRVAA